MSDIDIKKAEPGDLVEILYLLKVCVADMNNNGLDCWNKYLHDNTISNELEKGLIFLLKEIGVCKGMITLNSEKPIEYKHIHWSVKGNKPLYIHRLAIHPQWHGNGLAGLMMDFAGNYAREHAFDCIRLDVYSINERAKGLYEKHDFFEAGTFFAEYQKAPFICYEKQL